MWRPQFSQVEALNFKTKASACRTLLHCMQPDTYFLFEGGRSYNPHTMPRLVKCMPELLDLRNTLFSVSSLPYLYLYLRTSGTCLVAKVGNAEFNTKSKQIKTTVHIRRAFYHVVLKLLCMLHAAIYELHVCMSMIGPKKARACLYMYFTPQVRVARPQRGAV